MKEVIDYKKQIHCFHSFKSDLYFREVAKFLIKLINKFQFKSICLSGGNTPREIYNELVNQNFIQENLKFILSDERDVSLNSNRSNYKMIVETLFKNNLNFKNNFTYFDTSLKNSEEVISEYQSKLRNDFKSIDVSLLGLGEDTHAASLFPNIEYDHKQPVIYTEIGEESRYSLTPLILNNTNKLIFIAKGSAKKTAVINKINGPENTLLYPAQSIINKNTTWLIDEELSESLNDSLNFY